MSQRIRQSVWCCGRNYQRWRLDGGEFPPGWTHCCMCNRKLDWPKRSAPGHKAAASRWYFLRKQRFTREGLMTNGRPRRRSEVPMPIPERNRRMMQRYEVRRDEFFELGMTSRGTRRLINRRPATPLQKFHRELRAELEANRPEDIYA